MTDLLVRNRRWISYAARIWAIAFAAPHTWWALGIPAGFPGGEANHQVWMSSPWRYLYIVMVIILSALAVLAARMLVRPPHHALRHRIPRTAAWIAGGVLSLRGVAGLLIDGTSDLVWWPTFLAGGILFSALAWSARISRSARTEPYAQG
jgi:cytochrome bd-type quinol oxidase subunit 2